MISLEYKKMVSDIAKTVEGFQNAGFTINEKKSILVPVRNLTFLGFDIDTVCFTISVSAQKRVELELGGEIMETEKGENKDPFVT